MCDQDHFDEDLAKFEALGLVTRKQFGILLGAGVVMMLPQVANAVTVSESAPPCSRWQFTQFGASLSLSPP